MRHVASWNTSRRLVLLASLASLAACGNKDKGGTVPAGADQLAQGLHAFADCGATLDYFKREATRQMVVQIEAERRWANNCVMADAGEATNTAAPAASGAASSVPSFSGTNNQVQGVDEADLLKTFAVGSTLYTAYARQPQWYASGQTAGSVVFSQVSPVADAKVVSRLPMAQMPVGLFVNYPYAVALSSDYATGFPNPYGATAPAADMAYAYANSVKISVIDLHDLTQPKVVRERWVQGSFVSARMIDKAVRVVTTAWQYGPSLQYWPDNVSWCGQPTNATQQSAAWNALISANAQRIAQTTLEDWLPHQNDHFNGAADDHLATLSCAELLRPGTPAGLSTSRVTTFSLQDDTSIQAPWEDVAIVAEGDTVYASTANLYVTTNPYDASYWAQVNSLYASAASPDTRWLQWPLERTNVHRFDLTGGHTRYAASNEVDGSLINQFAIDETGDFTRIASTTQRWSFMQGDTSANHVFVLQWGAPGMPLVGQLRDLEKGEHITAVRFIGDVGYLSTLHNVVYSDPFLVVDLHAPAAPTLSASLPVPGDSTYLQALDANHVFGIGTSASTYGWASGVQLSVFDVTNPAAPVLQSNTPLQGQYVYSEALYDHHALTSFTLPVNGVSTHLIAFPLWVYDSNMRCDVYDCALDGVRVYSVDPAKGFAFLGDVYHNSLSSQSAWGWEQVRRSMLFNLEAQSYLVSASELGLKITDLSAFAAQTSEVPSVAQIAY